MTIQTWEPPRPRRLGLRVADDDALKSLAQWHTVDATLNPVCRFALVLLVTVGCARNDGVNDVGEACKLRGAWKNMTARECVNCRASVGSPACECTDFKAYAGKCKDQADEARGACADSFDACARACGQDCACVSKCYDSNGTCKSATASRDGCLTEVCDAVCR
jgi:hypothetical protein